MVATGYTLSITTERPFADAIECAVSLRLLDALVCGADLEQRFRAVVIDLQRGVLDCKALVEHRFQFSPDAVTVFAGAHEHVRGERRKV